MPAVCQVSLPILVLPLGWACRWKQSGSSTSPFQPGFSLCDPFAGLGLCLADEWKSGSRGSLSAVSLHYCQTHSALPHEWLAEHWVLLLLSDGGIGFYLAPQCELEGGGGRSFRCPTRMWWAVLGPPTTTSECLSGASCSYNEQL